MMFFKTRAQARIFASKTGRSVKDMGNAAMGSRWSVRVTN